MTKTAGLRSASWQAKLSFVVMGLGQLCYGQIVKGLLYLLSLAGLIVYFVARGVEDIIGIFTLGTQQENLWLGIEGDNSMQMLIMGLFAVVVLIFTVALYISNVKDVLFTSREAAKGKKPHSFRESIAYAADGKFYLSALVLPLIGVAMFSILPIVFMILIAFTDFGGEVVHPEPEPEPVEFSSVIWAVVSTSINFFGGLAIALILNKKNVKGSKIWRAFPILAYAIPGFITMLGFKFMFSQSGPINQLLTSSGHEAIFFLSNVESAKWWARGIGFFVNAWIAIPSIMLMTTGILSNIDTQLYEAASIDGAGKFTQFRKITLPFVVFSITPVLIGQFVGNFNNFGIYFFLRSGLQSNYADYFLASDTDLLINWLYNLSVSNNYYSIGAAISLVIFIITGTLSLIVYVRSAAYKREETFQ